ncbi:hypothetical protein [Pseudomonas paraglycinae]|uniref:hypothetical protein n=1 Tax=Pseudomonas paraglycinae TaxID=2892330 RepID=UPI003FD5B366
MKKLTRYLSLFVALSLPPVEAANQEIRALFQPDPTQPSKNVFINKTPNSGYCADYPDECAHQGMFSLRVPIRFSTFTPMFSTNGVWVKVPADWRVVNVINQQTQQTHPVEVRISGIGSRYRLSKPVTELTGEPNEAEAHRKLWVGSSWVYAASPCEYSGVGFPGATTYQFFWKTPVLGSCNKVALFDIGHMEFEYLDIAYELRTPNPLSMATGVYTGSLPYSVGPGSADFNMGPFFRADDANLTLDFVLDVQHELKVSLPPGGDKVTMEPPGGWRSWIETGRMPTDIYRDQLFHISASSRFKVMMICNSLGGSECGIGNNEVGFSKFEVRLTLPAGIVGPGNSDGWSGTLMHNTWLGPFEPTRYVDRKPGNLRFQIPRRWIESLLKPGMNGTLWGNVTVIFDSEV